MKRETLTGVLTVECEAITASVVQDIGTTKGFYLEISDPKTSEVLEREHQPSMSEVYARINTFNRFYRRHGIGND